MNKDAAGKARWWFQLDPPDWSLTRLSLVTAAVGLGLMALRKLLQLPSGYGVEDSMSWTEPEAWRVYRLLVDERLGWGVDAVMTAYWLIDALLFMPLYALLLGIWAVEWGKRCPDHFWQQSQAKLWAPAFQAAPLGALAFLLVADWLENCLALARLAQGRSTVYTVSAAMALVLPPGVFAVLIRGRGRSRFEEFAQGLQGQGSQGAAAVAFYLACALGLGAALLLSLWQPSIALSAAHAAKQLGMALCLGLLLLMGFWLLYGPLSPARQKSPPAWTELRSAMLLWPVRSRYPLVAIAFAALLMLGLDQGRDIVYAVAAHWDMTPIDHRIAESLAVLGLTVLATWFFGHTCWLWTRAPLMLKEAGASRSWNGAANVATRNWARTLGALGPLSLCLLCILALRDAVAVRGVWATVGLSLMLMAGLSAAVAALFVWRRDTAGALANTFDYLEATNFDELRKKLANPDSQRFTLWGWISPAWLPIAALVGAFACRGLSLAFPDWPSLALPVMLFQLSFWLGLAGWLSLAEHGEGVPWWLFVLAWIGVVGFFLSPGHHAVGAGHAAPQAAWGSSAALAAVLAGAYVFVLRRFGIRLLHAPAAPNHQARTWLLGVAATLGLIVVVLGLKNHQAQQAAAPASAPPPVNLELALGTWLHSAAAQRAPTLRLVVSEGGGIRSAFWTASVLTRLQQADEAFAPSVFAASGVSGGALGLAVWRACQLPLGKSSEAILQCVEAFGSHDYLGPLTASLLFEDLAASMLPTRWCSVPGCGSLSRGQAFERALLEATPKLTEGLRSSRRLFPSSTHLPYLLLNSTWVATGERSIASDLRIDGQFARARDQLEALAVPDLPLVTAAHNSARFPFTNAMGAVFPEVPEGQNRKVTGHLVDGGYFDNSGAQAAVDLLAALDRCLTRGCGDLLPDRAQSLAKVLRVELLVIRNGVDVHEGRLKLPECRPPDPPQPADLHPGPLRDNQHLSQPGCGAAVTFYADTLGILEGALNSTGIGANGHQALARLLGTRVAGLTPKVMRIDLVDDGPLFPLGWHLSRASRDEMTRRAEHCKAEWQRHQDPGHCGSQPF